MKIDRAAFLAITAAITVGCSAGSNEEASANDSAAVSANGGNLCYSADESHSFQSSELGFDPISNFPAAEGFCFEIAETAGKDADGFAVLNDAMYEKCNAYAKTYVPLTATKAYLTLRAAYNPGWSTDQKWDVFTKVDEEIQNEGFFCQSAIDRAICRDTVDPAACLRLATQLVPAAKEKLADCLSQHESITCTQSEVLRPDSF